MDPLETRELVKKSPTDSSKKDDGQSSETCSRTSPLCIFMELFQWLQMLSSQLNPTFIFGVVVVYGLSQGLSGSFFKVFTDYYWKDVQKVQPSAVQLYMGLYYIPWVMKPIWGLFTDVFPVRGYKRRPYFIVAGVLGCVSAMLIALLGKVPIAVALSCLVVGALIGYSSSGFFVHHLGPQAGNFMFLQLSLVLMAVPPVLLIVLGFVIYEVRSTSLQSEKKKAMEDLQMALRGMSKTIKLPQVWKPSLFIISTHEGHFYWYTDPKAGPAFSQEFVGIIYAAGALASIAGVLIYQKALKNYPFRSLLLYAQILYGVSGMLDLTFVLRWNLAIGIPDYFFVIAEECVTRIISRIRWMPMIVLSTRLCPLGIEGTFFALLMCIDSLGSLSSKWGGGVFLHLFHVTRSDFTNLWLVILIRNVLRFATIGLIFLVPRGDQADNLIPPDILTANSAASLDDDGLELVPVKETSEEVHLLIDEIMYRNFEN
uniref:Folate-biopterin transporter 6 n=1 Tax=Salix viminalis TaxID=40686 RepID=A0A6N2N8E7_SALVM